MAFDSNTFILVPPQDSSCHIQPGWHCDFYFGNGCDVIEEDALNEKYCIQVLRILITNADTDIDELEKDLVFLQSELAWTEYEEWSDICCNALRKKIDCLYISLRNLKSKDKNDMEVPVSMKPAEHLHEIVKALLRDHFQEKIKQPLDVVVSDSCGSSGSGSDVVIKEDMEDFSITPTENGTVLKTPLTHQGNESNNSETVKSIREFGPQPLELVAGHPDEKKVLGSFDLKDARKGECIEQDFTPKKKKMVRNSSLKSADERRRNLKMVKVQRVDNISKNSCRKALKHAVTFSKRKKPMNISDSKIISEETKDISSISAADVLIVDSLLNPIGKSTNMGMEVSGNEEVSTCCSTVSGRSKLLISSLNPKGKANPSKSDKPINATVQNIKTDALMDATGQSGRRNNTHSKLATSGKAKGGNSNIIPDALRLPSGLSGRRNDSGRGLVTSRQLKVENADGSPAALRHSFGFNQRRNNCDSRLGGFRQENGGNCDIDQKLCDFALKVIRKRDIKESNFTLAHQTDSSCSCSEAEGKKKHSQIIVDTEHSALTSPLELQDGKGKHTTKTLPEEGTMQPDVQTAETAVNDQKFNLDLSVKPKKQKAKRKTKSSLLNVQEPVSLSAKTVLKSPSIFKAKRQRKSGLDGSDSSSLDQSWKGKIMKKKLQNGQCEAVEKQFCSKYSCTASKETKKEFEFTNPCGD
ncbi:hypothetical protein ACOSQ2_014256 [Xanthoceras sorbifolium]